MDRLTLFLRLAFHMVETVQNKKYILIRNYQVTFATEMYRFGRRKTQVHDSLQHWKGLDGHMITPSILRNHFRRVFSTYTAIDTQYLPFPGNAGSGQCLSVLKV